MFETFDTASKTRGKDLVGDTDLIPMAVDLNKEYLINKYFISNDLQ